MENNQQGGSEKSAAEQGDKTSFTNSQPGQQLPYANNASDTGNVSPTLNEQHSESSLPRNENETLGTP